MYTSFRSKHSETIRLFDTVFHRVTFIFLLNKTRRVLIRCQNQLSIPTILNFLTRECIDLLLLQASLEKLPRV